MKTLVSFFLVSGLIGCVHPPDKRYTELVEPLVEKKASKQQVAKVLGPPKSCLQKSGTETCEEINGQKVCKSVDSHEVCEYRTRKGRNEAVAAVYRPQPGMGPDVSPYENHDVLKLYFNTSGELVRWEPIFIY